MSTLVTFLGKGRDDPNTGYGPATYRFPNGTTIETAQFGLGLAAHLGVVELVILGTRSSQWGVLVEALAAEEHDENLRIELMDAEAEGTVDAGLLRRCEPLMSKATGRIVKPRLIPFGRDDGEQMDILSAVDDAVGRGGVHFDVTHGFRHLGMVGFLSARMLAHVRSNLTVHGIWYGALDMRGEDGVAPVLRLDGLERVQRWGDALGRYDATGDYGVFAALLVEDGVAPDKAECLREAAYHERTMNVPDAARKLRTFLPSLDNGLTGASAVFRHRLRERLRWVQGNDLARQQRKLAFKYLDRGDYLRAAVLGWEALVTRQCNQRGLDETDHRNGRDPAIRAFEVEVDRNEHPGWRAEAFKEVRALRNALVHGTPPHSEEHKRILRDRDRLRDRLRTTFDQLIQPSRSE